jgi:GGDEF domain-containing protein
MTELGNNQLAQSKSSLNSPNIMPKAEWHQLLDKEVIKAQLDGQPLSVMFIDIDNLKTTNDTFGHDEGDRTIDKLQQAIFLIQGSFRTKSTKNNRPLDIASVGAIRETKILDTEIEGRHIRIEPGRIGGDEFAVICHTDSNGVEVIINRLRKAFRDTISKNLKEIGVDISIGASTLKADMNASKLLKLADKKLYADKKSHLPKLSDKDIIIFRDIIKKLKQMNIRPRDMGKYAALYAEDYIKNSRI